MKKQRLWIKILESSRFSHLLKLWIWNKLSWSLTWKQRYKPASRQDIRTKAFQKAYVKPRTSSFTQSLDNHLLGVSYEWDTPVLVPASQFTAQCKEAYKNNVFYEYKRNSPGEREKGRSQREGGNINKKVTQKMKQKTPWNGNINTNSNLLFIVPLTMSSFEKH